MKKIAHIPRQIVVVLITTYQFLLSPDHSWLKSRFPYGYCRHYPSCSEYSKQVILKFGVIRGGWWAIVRIVKCNPWTECSFDPAP